LALIQGGYENTRKRGDRRDYPEKKMVGKFLRGSHTERNVFELRLLEQESAGKKNGQTAKKIVEVWGYRRFTFELGKCECPLFSIDKEPRLRKAGLSSVVLGRRGSSLSGKYW